jgi:hypothetical protein
MKPPRNGATPPPPPKPTLTQAETHPTGIATQATARRAALKQLAGTARTQAGLLANAWARASARTKCVHNPPPPPRPSPQGVGDTTASATHAAERSAALK